KAVGKSGFPVPRAISNLPAGPRYDPKDIADICIGPWTGLEKAIPGVCDICSKRVVGVVARNYYAKRLKSHRRRSQLVLGPRVGVHRFGKELQVLAENIALPIAENAVSLNRQYRWCE